MTARLRAILDWLLMLAAFGLLWAIVVISYGALLSFLVEDMPW